MNNTRIQELTTIAIEYMSCSQDPVHDLEHVTRVVSHVTQLADDYQLSKEQTASLVLAAWWHDVARSLTKRPSIVIMPFIDDLISAMMLWYFTIKVGLYGSIPGMAARMIFCKSFGTGKILSRFLMKKKNRFMIDILDDADTLDILHIGRTKEIFTLVDSSATYRLGYKLMIWWFLSIDTLETKTELAKVYFLEICKEFQAWMASTEVFQWHVDHFGKEWSDARLRDLDRHISQLQLSLSV